MGLDLLQGADQRAVLVAVGGMGVYHEIGIAAHQRPVRVIAAGCVLVEGQLAAEGSGLLSIVMAGSVIRDMVMAAAKIDRTTAARRQRLRDRRCRIYPDSRS